MAMQRLGSRPTDFSGFSDAELVRLALQRDGEAFRAIMQRHNRRLYRVARSVMHDDSEAEDVVQEAYVLAFTNLSKFRAESSLATWLTRITLNEALGRLRRRRPTVDLSTLDLPTGDGAQVIPFPTMISSEDPERNAAQREIRGLIERAVDELPEIFRVVFVMRDVEDMSIEETAAFLSLRPETVKTRLHRARKLLRQALDEKLAPVLTDVFPFAGARCLRFTDEVLNRLALLPPPAGG
jgi:RNA polymerase sigma-70 factor, ECF subfamily